jgi:hypothetical protein
MIKQRNLFTGKIDLITDPDDNRAKIAIALYELQSQAGKIYGSHAPKARPQKEKNTHQTKLF